jgi:hypothetical protein
MADGRGYHLAMAKKKKRDSQYRLERLERDHPAIYKDYLDGKYRSVRQAAAAARLIRLPTGLDELKRGWKKTTRAEQAEFARWVRARMPKPAAALPVAIVDVDRRLTLEARRFLALWLLERDSKPGRLMEELGASLHDTRLSGGIKGQPLPPDIIPLLQSWMLKKGYKA